jgi:hypothetical protein
MTAPKKSLKQVRVYLPLVEEQMLGEALKVQPKLTESDLMSWIISAGLETLRNNDYKFEMPLAFKLQERGDTEHLSRVPPLGRGRK